VQTAVRLALAGLVAAGAAALATPAAANDCSNPKDPCGGCHLNLDATEITNLVECHPV
jgi:hypothetical protein